MSRLKLSFAVAAAALAVSGCTSGFNASVARFQALPVPQGQTFVVQAADPHKQGGIEFSQYAALVSQRLAQQGYRPAPDARSAELIVNLDYGVDRGRERVVSRPGFSSFGGWGPGWGGGFIGAPYRSGPRSSFYYGFGDPFFYPGFGYPEVSSYTVFTSHLDMTINRAADNQHVFEGRARALSTDDSLPRLVPNLVEAMFTGFPGNSGEEVRITVPTAPRRG